MKLNVLLSLLVIILLVVSGCSKKESKTLPDKEIAKQIVPFAPLPSFQSIFKSLDYLNAKDIAVAIPNELYKTKQEPARNAFALGVLTADGIIAARGRNKSKLIIIANEMTNLTTLLNLEGEINALADDMKTLIEKEQWVELEKALEKYKNDVESMLWERADYDTYTLLILGGWSEAANRVAWIIDQNYTMDKTQVINQKGTWSTLIKNLESIKTEPIRKASFYEKSIELCKQLNQVLDADQKGKFTKEQVKQFIQYTDAIKLQFKK